MQYTVPNADATIKCASHVRTLSPFPHFFAQFGASRTILHNFKYKNQQFIEKLG